MMGERWDVNTGSDGSSSIDESILNRYCKNLKQGTFSPFLCSFLFEFLDYSFSWFLVCFFNRPVVL